MSGNFSSRRGEYSTTPRLPPLVPDERLRFQDQSAIALLDQTYGIQSAMQAATADDRRARQLLEEQVRVITSVCKKLNQDIEALDSQLNERTYSISNLEYKTSDLLANNFSLNKDIQFKISRNDQTLNKLESEQMSLTNLIKDLQYQFQDFNRSNSLQLSDINTRINELNSKFDSVLMEQTMVLKNVEGDTVKQLQLIDSKTRMMLEDVRSQLNQVKATGDAEMSRMEIRLLNKIDEAQRNTEKYDRIDRRLEEYTQSINKRFLSFEEDYQRQLNKILSTIDKLEHKVNKVIEDRFSKTTNDNEKLKRDLKTGLADAEQSIVTLQKVIEGKIKLTEDKLEKEIDKLRKTIVLM